MIIRVIQIEDALTEKPKRDKYRINVPKLKEDENGNVWGGFVIEHLSPRQFQYTKPEDVFETITGGTYAYRSPKSGKATPLKREYIKDTTETLEEAIYGDDFTNPQTGYRKYIDVENVIDYILLEEISKDIDSFKSSMFMAMDENKRLTLSPWDYDGAFGNLPYELVETIRLQEPSNPILTRVINRLVESDLSPQGWHFQNRFLADRLMQDPEFVEQFKDKWYEHSETVLSPENILNIIDTNLAELESHDALDRNFDKWNNIVRNPIYLQGFRMLSFDGEVDRLKNFIKERHTWINENIDNLTTGLITDG